MDDDLADFERLIDAIRYLPSPVDPSTIWRWTLGVRGVKLKSIRVGGRLYTKKIWIEDFLEACQFGHTLYSQPDPALLQRVNDPIARQKEKRKPSRKPDDQ